MKVAVVTGAGIRVGRSIAKSLSECGYHVVCHANHSYPLAQELANSIEAAGGSAEAMRCDLADIDAVMELGKRILTKHPEISLLVNNAGVYELSSFQNITLKSYRRMQTINVEAPFFLTQALLPGLQKAKGAVINVTDSAVSRPYADYSHYFVSKAGLEILTRTLAIELAPDIRVNAVGPGTVAFPPDFDQPLRASIESKIPMKRIGSEQDIANAVVYLAKDGTFVTGQILRVDGGSSVT